MILISYHVVKSNFKNLFFMKNWKTTLGGILAAIGLGLTASDNAALHLIGIITAAVGTFLTGSTAVDAKKSN